MGSRDIIKKARDEDRSVLNEYESKQVLKELGIAILNEYFVKDEEEIKGISELRFPLVVKGVSKSILHKTEKGLVRLFVKDYDELIKVFNEFKTNAEVEGVLISPQLTDRRELLLGLRYDAQFGYALVFGLGGIFTEVLKDIAIRVCPITAEDAEEMMSEIRSARLLDAIRGYPPVDKALLVNMLLALSRVPEYLPDISEIDINPVMIDEGKPVAVDALIILKK